MNLCLFTLLVPCLLWCSNKPQSSPPPEETHQFDFWVGDWTCSGESYDAAGKPTHTDAENTITRTFDGHVVQENFRMGSFKGTSVSVFDTRAKLWKQTWVDNQGGYIDLKGSFSDKKMTLQTLERPKAPNSYNRMVFENITKDSFDWNWEASTDGGTTWKLNWHLHYTRKPATLATQGATAKSPDDLDFWVGQWKVYSSGELDGTDVVQKGVDGYAVFEHWTGTDGHHGESFFYFMPAKQQWKQVWSTEVGVFKEKVSEPVENGIRFSGHVFLPDGRKIEDRTTLTKLPNGDVRQVIESSKDGVTWKTTYDAVYKKGSR